MRAKLFHLKKNIKDAAEDKVVNVVKDRLIVDGIAFTVEGAKLKASSEEGIHKLSTLLGRDYTEWKQKILSQKQINKSTECHQPLYKG